MADQGPVIFVLVCALCLVLVALEPWADTKTTPNDEATDALLALNRHKYDEQTVLVNDKPVQVRMIQDPTGAPSDLFVAETQPANEPQVPRAKPPHMNRVQPQAGNTHKGIASVFGLESNNNIRQHPDWLSLVSSKCPLAHDKVLEEQLGQWSEISMDMLDMLYCERKHVARISHVNGELRHGSWQLSMDLNRLRSSMWLMQVAILRAKDRGNPIPDFELVLNPTDKTSEYGIGNSRVLKEERLPLFCNAKCIGDNSISFPIMFNAQLGGAAGEMSIDLYNGKYAELMMMGQPRPWLEKKPKLFFTSTNFRGNRQAIFDAKSPNVLALMQVVPISEYGDYQYLVYAFGHSGWSQRLRELAFMDAAMLVESSQCHEYYQSYFEEGKEYVPLKEDLSDLDQALDDLIASGKGQAMAKAWRTKGLTVLGLPCVLDYVEHLLRKYASLQQFTPVLRSSWPVYHLNATLSHYHARQMPDFDLCSQWY
eukprot:m.363641 g.363641  ORF g.363641 m.363641 type:complete len:482 (+) comp23347_c0_seq1:81-1526(+)